MSQLRRLVDFTVCHKLEDLRTMAVLLFVVVFYLVRHADAFGTMRWPVDLLMLWLAIAHIETSSALKLAFFPAKVTMNSDLFLRNILIFLLIHLQILYL